MANANRGLGKGLGALLGDVALRTDTSDSLYLPISQIEPYANQPRRHFDEEALQDLADSIREHGIACKVIYDATVPFALKDRFVRSQFMEIDKEKWAAELQA